MTRPKVSIFWFRRDLRFKDNVGLYKALTSGKPVIPLFIFDKSILDKLNDKKDPRISFIYKSLKNLHVQLSQHDAGFVIKYGNPLEVIKDLNIKYEISAIYTNSDYEPSSIERDKVIQSFCEGSGIEFHSFKDHVIFEKDEVLNQQGSPYKVFTPYKKSWINKLDTNQLVEYPSQNYLTNFFKHKSVFPAIRNFGFQISDLQIPASEINLDIIRNYDKNRDFPSLNGTSKLGIHFRHGTISIRKAVQIAEDHSSDWLNELIWREFYSMIMFHFPHVVTRSFRPLYDNIDWIDGEEDFKAWCTGKTGYPMVDAGMRELNATGFMHNRVRMITASFLSKHLLIDWRWGEAYFAEKLLDFELASNNGGWQWAAGTGTDAQPYFRIFNPHSQANKFDPKMRYIRKWIPEIGTEDYPKPIIEHKFAVQRAIFTYKQALSR